jgi:hypothetical protein
MSGDHTKYHGTAEVPKREWVGLTDDRDVMGIFETGTSTGIATLVECNKPLTQLCELFDEWRPS